MIRRLGPMLTVLIGVVLQFGGYYGMWAAAVGHINPPYWVMILLAMAACNGQAWYETAGLVTSVRNFETERWVVWNIMPCGGSLASCESSTRLNSVCCFAEQADGA